MSGRTLVAGIGNVFLGDDGFGVEAVRGLSAHPLPDDVEVVDFGVRGVHLAYQLLDGYDTLVLVDATARGGDPGTLYLIEADAGGPAPPGGAVLDGHHMSPDAVLALLDTLCAGTGSTPPRRTLVVGCEPASIEEGIGLSAPVAAAVPRAVRMVLDLLRAETETEAETEPAASTGSPTGYEAVMPSRELRSTP
ncbi:hydrogenase maturation protease [Streptomyces sp. NBC_00190]|uniref:hydrogenase maturation protease n=1 Tax=unclassified Streptomyces TaxID=2593676 RepID=UPI002E2A26FA|nr:hydrogenase maturation protease [Streptomyces sp. NBC_00190]WSZ44075.1 hydrogenase maturation protease [Streptomyces sp. NBC_00868]